MPSHFAGTWKTNTQSNALPLMFQQIEFVNERVVRLKLFGRWVNDTYSPLGNGRLSISNGLQSMVLTAVFPNAGTMVLTNSRGMSQKFVKE